MSQEAGKKDGPGTIGIIVGLPVIAHPQGDEAEQSPIIMHGHEQTCTPKRDSVAHRKLRDRVSGTIPVRTVDHCRVIFEKRNQRIIRTKVRRTPIGPKPIRFAIKEYGVGRPEEVT